MARISLDVGGLGREHMRGLLCSFDCAEHFDKVASAMRGNAAIGRTVFGVAAVLEHGFARETYSEAHANPFAL
jgi:hypothetical protein